MKSLKSVGRPTVQRFGPRIPSKGLTPVLIGTGARKTHSMLALSSCDIDRWCIRGIDGRVENVTTGIGLILARFHLNSLVRFANCLHRHPSTSLAVSLERVSHREFAGS